MPTERYDIKHIFIVGTIWPILSWCTVTPTKQATTSSLNSYVCLLQQLHDNNDDGVSEDDNGDGSGSGDDDDGEEEGDEDKNNDVKPKFSP